MIGKILIILLFLAISAIMLAGRGWWLIAGYNMKSKEERARYDEPKLCRFMGQIILGITVSVALQVADELWPGYYLDNIGWFVFAVMMGMAFAFSLTGYFRKKR